MSMELRATTGIGTGDSMAAKHGQEDGALNADVIARRNVEMFVH